MHLIDEQAHEKMFHMYPELSEMKILIWGSVFSEFYIMLRLGHKVLDLIPATKIRRNTIFYNCKLPTPNFKIIRKIF